MSRRIAALVLLLALVAGPVSAQQSRDTTLAKARDLLTTAGQRSDVDVAFHQSTKNPYNITGSMSTGLTNCESLEIVVSVTKADTIAFRIYPHYKGGYVNLGKAKDMTGLMRKLLLLTDENFLFWGADDTGDVFSGYSITMESGFPQDSIVAVLRSIRYTDKVVGALRPFIDGSQSP